MDKPETRPIVTHARSVRMDAAREKVVELMGRIWSGAVAEHDWTWEELTRSTLSNEYNAVGHVGKEDYLVKVANVEEWVDERI